MHLIIADTTMKQGKRADPLDAFHQVHENCATIHRR